MLLQAAYALMGFSVGIVLALIEEADRQATTRCAAEAQRRVARLRGEADARVAETYNRWATSMGAEVKRAYKRRMGGW